MEIAAALKKQPGILRIEAQNLIWTGRNGSIVEVSYSKVTGMRASPPTAAKARIQIVTDENVTLQFNSRQDLELACRELQRMIQNVISAKEESLNDNGNMSTTKWSTAAQSNAVLSKTESAASAEMQGTPHKMKKTKIDLDPARLLKNLDLQRQILKKNRDLMRTFQQVVVSGSITNEQFWTMRMDLLLTSAQQQAQNRGAYNVLSTIKPMTTSDNKINLSLTREKIHDIFTQYPIVRKAYNDNVPKLSEGEFWQRFFTSRLFLTLRGERISNNHPLDQILDKYIEIFEESRKRRKTASGDFVAPRYIDVEANTCNNPETLGNQPDFTMRPQSSDANSQSLIRSMNGLSQKLLGSTFRSVQTSLANRHAEAADADLEQQLKYDDLENTKSKDDFIALRMKKQQTKLNTELQVSANFLETQSKLFDSPIDISRQYQSVGSQDVYEKAQDHLIKLLAENVSQCEPTSNFASESDQVHICHITSLEFLRQFWYSYTRGEPVQQHRECLERSCDRINAVIEDTPGDKELTRAALSSLLRSIKKALSLEPPQAVS